MTLKQFTDDTRVQVAFTLSLVWILAIWQFRTLNSFIYPLVALISMLSFDILITYLRYSKTYYPFSSLVSGLLIGLIIAPVGNIWVIICAALLASLSKQFIGRGIRQHIFNPAAFGIMSSSILFQVPIAWWGVAWGIWPSVILIPLIARVLIRLKRLMLPVSFLVVMYIYLIVNFFVLSGGNSSGGSMIADLFNFTKLYFLDGTLILFAFVMLPEPITSVATGKFKYFFGVLVSALAIIIGLINIKVSSVVDEVFLTSLLLANLVCFLLLRFRKTSNKSLPTNKK